MVSPKPTVLPPADAPVSDGVARLGRILPVLLVVLAPLAIFSGALRGQFLQWDDPQMVTANPLLHPATGAHLRSFWAAPYFGLYVPLTYTTYALLARSVGIVAFPFHLANLAFHLGSALLVFSLLRRLIARSHAVACAGGALLYALHPTQVEPVAWVGNLDTCQSAFFALLALRLYWEYAQARARRAACLWYPAALVAFLLALLSKPSAVIVPLLALTLDVGLLRRPPRRALRAILPWLLLSAVWVRLIQHSQPLPVGFAPPLWLRPFVAGDALAFYLGKLLVPVGLTANYGRTPQVVLSHLWGFWTWLLPAALAILCWRARRQYPFLLAGLGIFAAALLPVLGLVPFVYQYYSTVADRYLSLALLGPSLVAAASLSRLPPRAAARLALPPLLLLGVLSLRQIPMWHDSVTLFTQAAASAPRNPIMHLDLGNSLLERGDAAAALNEFETARGLAPNDARIHCNIGVALVRLGRQDKARQAYEIALHLDPTLTPARIGLAALAGSGTITPCSSAPCPSAATSISRSASASAPTATSIRTAGTPTPTSPAMSPR